MRKLKPTPKDIEGPYYRENVPFRNKISEGVTGETLYVHGRVTDTNGNPVKALIDVWQADPEGNYDNDSDDFLLRGKIETNDDGIFCLETVPPGRYLLEKRKLRSGEIEEVYRPSHIHYKVSSPCLKELTTQMYFENDPFNSSDPYFQQELCVKKEKRSKEGREYFVSRFDVVLEGD